MERKKSFYALLCLFMLAYIGLFCYLGLYAVPWKDDYSTYYNVDNLGVWESTIHTFTYGVPRFSGFLITNFLAKYVSMESFYGFYVLFAALTYIAALYFAISTFYPEVSPHKKFLSTLIITAATFTIHCALNQVFYWLVGSHYFWSTSMMLVVLAMSVKVLRRGGGITLISSIVLMLISCFFLETATIFQGVIAFFTAIYFYKTGINVTQKFLPYSGSYV